MKLVLSRIDDRLVHGQVVVGCCDAIHVERIVLIQEYLGQSQPRDQPQFRIRLLVNNGAQRFRRVVIVRFSQLQGSLVAFPEVELSVLQYRDPAWRYLNRFQSQRILRWPSNVSGLLLSGD